MSKADFKRSSLKMNTKVTDLRVDLTAKDELLPHASSHFELG